jgi:hypothetical protein
VNIRRAAIFSASQMAGRSLKSFAAECAKSETMTPIQSGAK